MLMFSKFSRVIARDSSSRSHRTSIEILTCNLPSSMTGKPVSALVPPGRCQFGEKITAVPLLERFPVSKTSSVVRFALPNKKKPLNLSTCACILANADIKGENITRPYTPISTNKEVGYFDLLVKDYGPDAHMSHHLVHKIKKGDTINFKHIDFNVKIQAPFSYDHICMLVGGTGMCIIITALQPFETRMTNTVVCFKTRVCYRTNANSYSYCARSLYRHHTNDTGAPLDSWHAVGYPKGYHALW